MNTYLGDSVYATDELNPGHITLTTGSHKLEDADQIIHLKPEVLEALLVMKALNAGRWERKESGIGGKLDYIATIDGWTVYEIPAVPASTGKRKRVICAKGAEPANPEPADPTTAIPDSYPGEN